MTGSLVSPATRDRVRGLATPVAKGLGRLGLTPNALTVIGFLGTCLAALAAALQLWLVAGVLVLAFGIFDLFDGTLARATGRASKLGAFLDSTFDRAGEGIVYLGIAAGCLIAGFDPGALLAASAMAASFMVSYTRAKSESLGFTPGTGMASIGVAPREVRILILAAALIVADLAGGIAEPLLYLQTIDLPFGITIDAVRGREYLTLGLSLITILATLTTIQRVLHVRAQAREG